MQWSQVYFMGFQVAQVVKNPPAAARDSGSIPDGADEEEEGEDDGDVDEDGPGGAGHPLGDVFVQGFQ